MRDWAEFPTYSVVHAGALHDRGVREFDQNALIQSPGSMALLARCQTVRFQNRVNEPGNQAELWLGAFRVAVLRW